MPPRGLCLWQGVPRGPLGKGFVAVACLRPLPGLGSEGNGSVKSRAGGNGPRVGPGESGAKRKNVFSFPSPFFTSLFLPRIISANQGKSRFTKSRFTKSPTFSLKIPPPALSSPLVLLGWGIPPNPSGANWEVCRQFWGKGCELLLLPAQSSAGGEGHLVLWGSPPPFWGEHPSGGAGASSQPHLSCAVLGATSCLPSLQLRAQFGDVLGIFTSQSGKNSSPSTSPGLRESL